MGYSIIFETKIVKMEDGRIIHFDRSGCNNDNEGRKKNEFTGRVYNESDFVKFAENFKKNSKPFKNTDIWDLKIGNRCATMYDYGDHLLRMLKRAKRIEDFLKEYYFWAYHFKGIELLSPEHKEITDKREIDKIFYDSIYTNNGIRYRRMVDYPKDINVIIGLIENNEPITFSITKKLLRR